MRYWFLAIVFTALTGWAAGVSAAADRDWQSVKSEHFSVYYKKAPLRFVQDTLRRAEEVYRRTSSVLGFVRFKGWIGRARVDIRIYDNADDYRASSGYVWAAASVDTDTRRIAAFPSSAGFFEATLPHEIGHIIFRDFVGKDAQVPLWFEEGVATFQEEGGRWEADAVAREAVLSGQGLALRDMGRMELTSGTNKELVHLFYSQAASLVGFLVREGEGYRFLHLCRALRDGSGFDRALKKSYMRFASLDALEKAWKGYLADEKNFR